MYAGQAVGASTGGWLIANNGMGLLHWAGLVLLVVAIAVSAVATRHDKRRLAALSQA
ncbi:MAG: hypothetical protein H7255_10500 [Ramlibacter sp.]|nr:hypothetical protein [Ramlibacter sp.]